MVLPAQVTLEYSVTTANNQTDLSLLSAMQAVVLYTSPTQDPLLCQVLGLTVQNDSSGSSPGTVTRIITLNMTIAAGAPVAPPSFDVHPPPKEVPRVVLFSSAPADTAGGAGAQSVTLGYLDEAGNAATVTVALEGRTPVAVPLAGNTSGFFRVTQLEVATVGASGASQGQITLSSADAEDRPIDAIAMLPVSYFALCGGNLGAMVDNLRNLFTATLARALVTPVTAAVPVLS